MTRVQLQDVSLRIHFDDQSHADFHYFWLRHNCDGDRNPLTGEHTECSSDFPLDIRPRFVELSEDGQKLEVVWDRERPGHESVYSIPWLREHAYAVDLPEVLPPPSALAPVEVFSKTLTQEQLIATCIQRLDSHGLILVRGYHEDTESLISLFEHANYRVRTTHFGRIEDLRTDNTTNQNTDQLGYTDAAIQLHTDQPFIDHPPRYQLLHCQTPAHHGGESFLVDALQAARYLQHTDTPTFLRLTTTPVRFHRKQKAFESLNVSPILTMNGTTGFQVRYSYFTMAPHRRPFGEMEAWYRAYNRFATLVRDRRYQYRFRLEAGDFVLYDNFRMLHARTGFSGPRWVKGVYFDPASPD